MTKGGRTASTFRGTASRRFPRPAGRAFVFLAAFLSLFDPRSPSAHEVIDAEQVRAALATATGATGTEVGAALHKLPVPAPTTWYVLKFQKDAWHLVEKVPHG